MMNLTSPARVRQDARLIKQTLFKLSAPRMIIRSIVIVLAILLWLYVSTTLLAFGRSIDYSGLNALGQQIVDLLVRINPYLWWVAAGIWTLLLFFSVRAWLHHDIDNARSRSVEPDVLADLSTHLSDEVVEVLLWCWGNREEPFTIGDLRRARHETRYGRIEKIALVREQEAILLDQAQQARPATRAARPDGTPGPAPCPPAGASACEEIGRHDVEPVFHATELRRRIEPSATGEGHDLRSGDRDS